MEAERIKKYVKLGMAIQRLKDDFYFKRIVKFLKGDLSEDYCVFKNLKPLYDEFGYKKINQLILEIADEEEKSKEGEKNE